jgi:hypothetical protein
VENAAGGWSEGKAFPSSPKKSQNSLKILANSSKNHWIYRHIHPFFLYIREFMVYIIIRELVV